MKPELILGIAAVIVSVIFEYFPKLHEWYNAKPDNEQRGIMFIVLVAVVGVTVGLSCGKLFGVSIYTCDEPGFERAILDLIGVVTVNQGTHRLLPKFGASEG